MEEIWKDIKGYEGLYQVSNLGRVRSLDRVCKTKGFVDQVRVGRILKQKISKSGYCHVTLSKDKVHKMFRTHRLVAQEFIPNPHNYPQVNHIDEHKQNNCVDNLEWCDVKYNINFGTRIERMIQTQIDNGRFHQPSERQDIRREKKRLWNQNNRLKKKVI